MGQGAEILLVSRRWLLAVLAVLSACHAPAPPGETVTAHMATAHGPAAWFVWAGVRPPPGPPPPEVYLLAGEVRGAAPDRMVPLRPGVPHLGKTAVWLVVRTETLDWGPGVLPRILSEAARWRVAGRIEGIQIDFDAATLRLDRYAAFLRALRAQLPRDLRLSVTGLLDGAANGRPEDLAAIGGVVDELVIQTYQGRCPIPGADHYLDRLARVPLPFRVAVVEHARWHAPAGLDANSRWRGLVVFLLPPGPAPVCMAPRNTAEG